MWSWIINLHSLDTGIEKDGKDSNKTEGSAEDINANETTDSALSNNTNQESEPRDDENSPKSDDTDVDVGDPPVNETDNVSSSENVTVSLVENDNDTSTTEAPIVGKN